jgi:hypothetical protein
MDPATDAVLQIWDTAATVDGIYSRLGYLNVLLGMNIFLLAPLIRTVGSNKKDGEK